MKKMLKAIIKFFGFDNSDKNQTHHATNNATTKGSAKIIKFKNNKKELSNYNFKFYYPDSYEEVKKIVDNLKNNKPAIVNLEKINKNEAKKIIDFIGGAVYALDGNVKKVGSGVFLITPANIKIDGEHLKDKFKNKILGG